MKLAEQLEMVRAIPLDKLLLETGMYPTFLSVNVSLTSSQTLLGVL
jgi:Tat protein secretion system quality control protein TatD with DNase activity